MLSSQIKSNEIVFGSCNKDLLEEIIFYGIGLGADFVEIFLRILITLVSSRRGFYHKCKPIIWKGCWH